MIIFLAFLAFLVIVFSHIFFYIYGYSQGTRDGWNDGAKAADRERSKNEEK